MSGATLLLGGIVLGARHWLGPAVLLTAAALLVLVWNYRRSTTRGWVKVAAPLLKGLGIVLLAVCLVEPLYTGTRPRPGSNLFLVVADTSRSLELANPGSPKPRGEEVRASLAPDVPWLTRLAQDFDVRRYTFDSAMQPVQDFSAMTFGGDASSLVTALGALRDRFQGQPVAGILLLTDGNATDLPEEAVDWKGLPPVYPVSIASEADSLDVSVGPVSVTQTNFDAAPVTISAEIAARGTSERELAGKKITVRVLDEEQKTVEKRTLAATGKAMAERFLIKPDKAGISFYQIHAALEGEEDLKPGEGRSAEATLANNRRFATVDRGGGPYRILYLTGRPNWEYKFLRRAIEKDDEVKLVGLIRVAKKEPKFNFLSRTGERTNPLFRGFGNDKDETAEQYDEPVLIRLGAEDKEELKGGFPKDQQDLFRYHAVVLDDIEAGFFNQDQQSLLEKFVSQRGGGLLMLGGKDSYAEGGYVRTPIGGMLPVYLDRGSPGPAPGEMRLKLTREGWVQPWVRVRSTESEEETRLAGMPPFQSFNRVDSIKPGASVLAEVETDGGVIRPALAVQPFGRGRVGALLVGDMWRWDMRRPDPKESDLEKSWRQTVRWLVADVPQRVEAEVRRTRGAGLAPVELVIRARDKEFGPLDNATVKVTVATPDRRSLEIAAEMSSLSAGEYRASFAPRDAGTYRATVSVTSPDGSEVGTRETGWSVEPETEEFSKLTGNGTLLARLAAESGGEVISPSGLERFVSSLPNRKIPVVEQWTYPIWHQWSVALLAVACLAGEWGLRRWKGMA